MTDWKWRIYLFVRAADDTAGNRQAFAEIYVNNGSGESLADEKRMLDSVVRLSTTGQEPAQAFGVNTVAKTSMRGAFKALLDALTNARYAAVASVAHGQWQEHELVLTNFPVTPSGQIVTWERALQYLEAEFGLKVIPPPSLP